MRGVGAEAVELGDERRRAFETVLGGHQPMVPQWHAACQPTNRTCVSASVKKLAGKVNASAPQMRQTGGRLVAWGGWIAALRLAVRPTRDRPVFNSLWTRAGLHGLRADGQRVGRQPAGKKG